ncbi:MAG: acyl carrier protein [Lentisphaerae bacterium]|nr:acyl carrier protein [Lentisphaerota bacterium]
MEDNPVTREEMIDRLRKAMSDSSTEDVDWDSVTEATEIGSLGFDSLSILDLIYEIQREFKIKFAAEEIVKVRTVGHLLDFLQARV